MRICPLSAPRESLHPDACPPAAAPQCGSPSPRRWLVRKRERWKASPAHGLQRLARPWKLRIEHHSFAQFDERLVTRASPRQGHSQMEAHLPEGRHALDGCRQLPERRHHIAPLVKRPSQAVHDAAVVGQELKRPVK